MDTVEGSAAAGAAFASLLGEREDASLVMSQINSEPHGKLEGALGDNGRALIEAFGVELLDTSELDLTLGCTEREKAPLAEC